MATRKKSSKSGSASKPSKPKEPPKPSKGSNDNAAAPAPKSPTADQMVLALANALVGTLNGQNAAIALNALAAATARICLTTKTKSADFSTLLTSQIEAQATLMIEKGQATAKALAEAARLTKGGKLGGKLGGKRGGKRGGK